MSLVARHLEENGVPTVVLGSARDIVEHCGVPRFLFVDFPLGNPCGPPDDPAAQLRVVEQGVRMLETATRPNTTERASVEWAGDPDWRLVYNRIDDKDPADLLAEGDRRRARMAKRPKRDP